MRLGESAARLTRSHKELSNSPSAGQIAKLQILLLPLRIGRLPISVLFLDFGFADNRTSTRRAAPGPDPGPRPGPPIPVRAGFGPSQFRPEPVPARAGGRRGWKRRGGGASEAVLARGAGAVVRVRGAGAAAAAGEVLVPEGREPLVHRHALAPGRRPGRRSPTTAAGTARPHGTRILAPAAYHSDTGASQHDFQIWAIGSPRSCCPQEAPVRRDLTA